MQWNLHVVGHAMDDFTKALSTAGHVIANPPPKSTTNTVEIVATVFGNNKYNQKG